MKTFEEMTAEAREQARDVLNAQATAHQPPGPRQMAYSSRSGLSGVETPIGNVDYPGERACGLSFSQWAQMAKDNGGFVPAVLVGFSTSIYGESARDAYCRKVRAAGGNPSPEADTGALPGPATGIATTAYHVSQKTFTRAEVLTIIRAEQARLGGLFPDDHPVDTTLREGAKRLASSLISIFERME